MCPLSPMKSNFLTLASNAPSSMSSILLFLMLNSLASEYTEPLSRTPISLSYIENLMMINTRSDVTRMVRARLREFASLTPLAKR